MVAASRGSLLVLCPVGCDLAEGPLVVGVVPVTVPHHQGAAVGVQGQALARLAVLDLLGVLGVAPGPVHLAHIAPGHRDAVRPLHLD